MWKRQSYARGIRLRSLLRLLFWAPTTNLILPAGVSSTDAVEILPGFVQAHLIRSASIVRIVELDVVVFPPAHRTDIERPRRLLVEGQGLAARTRELFPFHCPIRSDPTTPYEAAWRDARRMRQWDVSDAILHARAADHVVKRDPTPITIDREAAEEEDHALS